MLTRRPKQRSRLDEAIDDLFEQLVEEPFDADKYAKMVDQLTRLHKLKEFHTPKRVSPDTLALVAGNLIGIALILWHERAGVITSKAIGFVLRLK